MLAAVYFPFKCLHHSCWSGQRTDKCYRDWVCGWR